LRNKTRRDTEIKKRGKERRRLPTAPTTDTHTFRRGIAGGEKKVKIKTRKKRKRRLFFFLRTL